ncbi:hypothetical protein [Nostoc sp. JL33]|uniref:hypothetical protein n=1 Tax=Nostoc sp. JL33 TaxID=2815396 RepID=UPI0025E4D0B3|nr:hypothetical protein [Nostoc sp. JL33]MBN3874256.1 hypothetical protein [Nostoc sp. JL33]
MLLSLAHSRKALPESLPNPPVGCVLADADEIIAQGYTQALGQYHTEADALAFHSFLVLLFTSREK